MSLIALFVIIIVVVLLLYVIQTAPIANPVLKWVLMAMLILVFCLVLLSRAGLISGVNLR